jgi:protocatechuate 3,4-dioxygenase beta subunit
MRGVAGGAIDMTSSGRVLTRRGFATTGLAAAALAAGTGRALAQTAPPPGTAGSDIGPFYPIQRPDDSDADLVWIKGHKDKALGQVIEVSGRVLDRYGKPIRNATLELWQANAAGRYAHPNDISTAPLDPNFQGYASLKTGNDGEWRITTIKPAAYSSPIGLRTPHIHFDIQGRAHRLIAQMYFADEAPTNKTDELYKGLGADAPTSVADLAGADKYRWDVVLMDG